MTSPDTPTSTRLIDELALLREDGAASATDEGAPSLATLVRAIADDPDTPLETLMVRTLRTAIMQTKYEEASYAEATGLLLWIDLQEPYERLKKADKLPPRRKKVAELTGKTPNTLERYWEKKNLFRPLAEQLLALEKARENEKQAKSEATTLVMSSTTTEATSESPDRVSNSDSGQSSLDTSRTSSRDGRAGRLPVGLSSWVIGVLCLLVVSGGVYAIGSRTSADADAGVDQPLGFKETPKFGTTSPTLGYGDSDGQRDVFDRSKRERPGLPVLNSMVGEPALPGRRGQHELLDERKFVAVSRSADLNLESPTPETRSLFVGDEEKWIVIYVTIVNNGSGITGCYGRSSIPKALGMFLRMRVWDSPDYKNHVFRFWAEGKNTFPTWITDAVEVKTKENTRWDIVSGAGIEGSGQPELLDYGEADALNTLGGFHIGTVQKCLKGQRRYAFLFKGVDVTVQLRRERRG